MTYEEQERLEFTQGDPEKARLLGVIVDLEEQVARLRIQVEDLEHELIYGDK